MHLFKSATAYNLTELPEFSQLEALTAPTELSGSQSLSVGWSKAFDTDGGDTYIELIKLEKKLKPAALKRAVSKEVKRLEAKTGEKLSRLQRKEVQELIIDEHIPGEMAVESRTQAYIDARTKQLIVDSSSNPALELFMKEFVKAFQGCAPVPVIPKKPANVVMLEWLKQDEPPSHVEIVGALKFANPEDLSHSAVINMDQEAETIGSLINDGMMPETMVIEWALNESDSLTFKLRDDGRIDGIRFAADMTAGDGDDPEHEARVIAMVNADTLTAVMAQIQTLFS